MLLIQMLMSQSFFFGYLFLDSASQIRFSFITPPAITLNPSPKPRQRVSCFVPPLYLICRAVPSGVI